VKPIETCVRSGCRLEQTEPVKRPCRPECPKRLDCETYLQRTGNELPTECPTAYEPPRAQRLT